MPLLNYIAQQSCKIRRCISAVSPKAFRLCMFLMYADFSFYSSRYLTSKLRGSLTAVRKAPKAIKVQLNSAINQIKMTHWKHSPATAQSMQSYQPSLPVRTPIYYGNMILQPRQFEELHFERCYLLQDLEKANNKAIELLRQILSLEDLILQTTSNGLRRKTKKRAGWLRNRVAESARQEQALLVRLGQLAYEIRSRERLTQIEAERAYHEQILAEHVPWNGAQYIPPWIPMDPKHAQEYFAGSSAWSCDSWGQQYRYENGYEPQTWERTDTPELSACDDSVAGSPRPFSFNKGKLTELDNPSSCSLHMECTADLELIDNCPILARPLSSCGFDAALITNEEISPFPRIRRNSLPEFPSPIMCGGFMAEY